MRIFWLSFADTSGFLGVAVVDVTEEMAADIREELTVRFPHHGPGAEWIAAASREAHLMGCNPGGEVLSTEVDPALPVPRNRLLQRPELEALSETRPALSENRPL